MPRWPKCSAWLRWLLENMKAFRFRLARVLDWQRSKLSVEEQKLEQLTGERDRLEAARSHARNERTGSGRALATWTGLRGMDLERQNAYAVRLQERERALGVSLQDCARRIEYQRLAVAEARRKVRLLERLAERRLAEWNAELARELEALTSEFTIAQYGRASQPRKNLRPDPIRR
jgi:flagellar export protein FliJ